MTGALWATLYFSPVTILTVWLILREKSITESNNFKEKEAVAYEAGSKHFQTKITPAQVPSVEQNQEQTINKSSSMSLLEPFKKLPQGYYRLVIVGWIVLPLTFAGIAYAATEQRPEESFFAFLLFGIPIYYVLARFGIWVYDGFKK